MMSKWNMQNPLVKIMVNYFNTLEMETHDYVKHGIIYTSIMTVVFLITAVLIFNDQSSFYLYLLFGAIFMYTTTRYVNILLSEIKGSNINNIVMGDDYKVADINNEKIFSLMCEIRELCGRIRSVKDMHLLITFIFCISSLLYLLRIYI